MALGDKVKETLKNWFTEVTDVLTSPIEWAIDWGFERAVKRVIPNSYTYFKTITDRIEGAASSPSLKELIESGKLDEYLWAKKEGDPFFAGIEVAPEVIKVLSGIGAILGSPLGLFPGIGALYTAGLGQFDIQSAQEMYRPTILSPAEAINIAFKLGWSKQWVTEMLALAGYKDTLGEALYEAAHTPLAPDQLRQLELRGEEEFKAVSHHFRAAGYSDEAIAALKKLYWIIPGPADLIRMAVREAFTPAVIEKYYEAYPPPGDFVTWAAKQGLNADWANRYWYAHWVLPSITQGFEMLHRTTRTPIIPGIAPKGTDKDGAYYPIIDESTLRELLTYADVLPWWHDKIIEIAYHPYTRVDIRRMHKIGILDRDEVKSAYLDLGFNEEKAENMTKFTIAYNLGTEKDLTKSEIIKLWKQATITETEATDMLLALDYSEDDVELLLSESALEETTRQRDLTVTNYRQLYQLGISTKTDVTVALADLGYSKEEIELLYKIWDYEAIPKLRQPTRADLDRFFKAAIIDEPTYITEMSNLGYSEKYLTWYLSYVKGPEEVEESES